MSLATLHKEATCGKKHGKMKYGTKKEKEKEMDKKASEEELEAAQAIINKGFMDEITKEGAKRDPKGSEKHYMRRALVGTPISSAIEAKKGKKMTALGEAYGHAAVEGLKGLGVGAGAGAAAGLATGGVLAAKTPVREAGKFLPKKTISAARAGRLKGPLAIGAIGGAILGSWYGTMKGHFGRKASEIHGKYAK